jgi:hypothetical protein
MSKSRGIFLPEVIKQNLDHLIDHRKVHLPTSVEYRIPPELANKFKDVNGRRRFRVDPSQTTTLTQPTLACLTYMDVGLWAGDGPSEDASDATWGRRRDFGIVCGRLALLCSYIHGDDSPKANIDAVGAPATSPEFAKVQPLLNHLSSRKSLGKVVVTSALLGRSDLAEKPTDQKIHVFLGDLHAPVMTVKKLTYSDVDPRPAEYTMSSSPPSSYSSGPRFVETRPASKHPMRGRYNPGIVVRALLPFIAKLLNATVDDLNNHSSRRFLTLPLLAENRAAILAILERVWAETPLGDSPDTEEENQSEVEHWFELYHGAGTKGAEIFQSAGADLKDWLDLLVDYQRNGQSPPIRLLQLGDLFDLWMGLKCGFTDRGAWHYTAAAKAFAEHWIKETEYNTNQSDAIHMLRRFDDWLPPDQKVHPVFLYGNHDNYMGTLLGLPAQFKDTGLVAQHGHQADDFNSDSNAKIGYLLTQAAFAVLAVRLLEDPISALAAGIKGGIGPRLAFTEMALEEAVFKPILAGKKPAMTFVMGHTHEPVLQEIRVLEYIPANPPDSPQPPDTQPPAEARHHKVKVTVQFLQVDITNDGKYPGAGHWWMCATVRQWSLSGAGAPRVDLDLFNYRPVNTHDSIPLPGGQVASLDIEVDAGLVIEANAGGDEGEPDGISIMVGSLTWGGTRTIECQGKNRGYKVTFELLWGNILN